MGGMINILISHATLERFQT